jgi:hypothetical protein
LLAVLFTDLFHSVNSQSEESCNRLVGCIRKSRVTRSFSMKAKQQNVVHDSRGNGFDHVLFPITNLVENFELACVMLAITVVCCLLQVFW